MSWFVLALLSAIFIALRHLGVKLLVRGADEYVVSWAMRTFSSILLFPFCLYEGMPDLANGFWMVAVIGALVAPAGTLLYTRALSLSDMSLVIPLINLTPLCLLITSPLMLGEFPNGAGLVGIVLVVLGAYLLNIAKSDQGLLAPFTGLFRDRGCRTMLLVVFLYSIGGNLDKIGTVGSSPLFWAFLMSLAAAMALFPLMCMRSTDPVQQVRRNLGGLLLLASFAALSLICQMYALKTGIVPYVASVKRTSALITVLLGAFILRESDLHSRFFGSLVMVAGVIMIAVLG